MYYKVFNVPSSAIVLLYIPQHGIVGDRDGAPCSTSNMEQLPIHASMCGIVHSIPYCGVCRQSTLSINQISEFLSNGMLHKDI